MPYALIARATKCAPDEYLEPSCMICPVLIFLAKESGLPLDVAAHCPLGDTS